MHFRLAAHLVALSVCIASQTGCITALHTSGGYFYDEALGTNGGAASLHTSFGSEHIGAGGNMLVKQRHEYSQISLGAHGYAIPTFKLDPLVPYLRAGFQAAQLEWVEGEFGFGTLSPFSEVGVLLLTGNPKHEARPGFSFSVTGGYDTRFADRPSGGHVLFQMGVGLFRAERNVPRRSDW